MPVMAGVQFATYNDVDSLKALVNEKTAMVTRLHIPAPRTEINECSTGVI